MRAFIVTGPGRAEVQDIPEPVAIPGEVVIDVDRVGVCGTDVEFYTGEMQYLHDGHASYPMLLGHEWMGRVREVGDGVDPSWVGRRVTADTMLGCQQCARCAQGLQHVCAGRTEIGVRGGRPGALAERIAVPAWSVHALPDSIDDTVGALIEPGGNALRSLDAAEVTTGDRLLVIGPGTIGLLVAMLARARGVDVHLLGSSQRSLAFAASIGFEQGWTDQTLPDVEFDAVIDASNDPGSPARAIDLVMPGKRVVYIGIAGEPSAIDSRRLVFNDVTAVGILSASPGLPRAIEQFASGSVDPRPLVAATIGLDSLADVLAGRRPPDAGPGPKVHVDPRVRT
ncbi:MAG: alcohol dehydrogenase catalytic domain-containing protein [Actinomycetales bacterium]|nr:alcohol dehydrogenase catalytic domain-containing protein [Actinomycetales bacterium]